MKQAITLLAGITMFITGLAQTDSTKSEGDTIRVGGMILSTKTDKNDKSTDTTVKVEIHQRKKTSAITTNWWIVDIGFANYTDNTNYPVNDFAPGLGKDQFKLRAGKSVNVNIWVFMQKLKIIKNVVNLKYGIGVELNNYRYKEPIKYLTSPTLVELDKGRNYTKNKLAADYLTVPMMLNFNFTPNKKRGFGLSIGASAGYLYASRQKTITNTDGKQKERDDFDLRPWKLSYIGELNMGWVKLYGSLASQSMFEKGPDQTPYNFGFRIGY
jgi:hypothetical protein